MARYLSMHRAASSPNGSRANAFALPRQNITRELVSSTMTSASGGIIGGLSSHAWPAKWLRSLPEASRDYRRRRWRSPGVPNSALEATIVPPGPPRPEAQNLCHTGGGAHTRLLPPPFHRGAFQRRSARHKPASGSHRNRALGEFFSVLPSPSFTRSVPLVFPA